MLPRDKIIQCFQCENNLACWGLLEDIPLGRNEREFYPDHEKLMKELNKLPSNKSLNIAEYYGTISALFMQSLRFDRVVDRRDVYQLISFLCAQSNTNNDSWTCPVNDPEDDDNFSFVPRG